MQGASTATLRTTASATAATAATTNTLDVRIVGLYDEAGNTDYSAVGHQYVVRLNHPYNSGVGAAVGTLATTAI